MNSQEDFGKVIYRQPDIENVYGLPRSTMYDLIKEESFQRSAGLPHVRGAGRSMTQTLETLS